MSETIQVVRVERVASGDIDDGDFITFDPTSPSNWSVYQVVGDVIELEGADGEYWGGFADEVAPPKDSHGRWYWRFWVWAPQAEILRGYGEHLEIRKIDD